MKKNYMEKPLKKSMKLKSVFLKMSLKFVKLLAKLKKKKKNYQLSGMKETQSL